MRSFVFGGVVGAVAMFAVSAGVHSQQIPAASMISQAQASGIVDIRALQASIDVAALPRLDLNHMD